MRAAFHVKQRRPQRALPTEYPQARQAFYVVFHVKLGSLWITSVDNRDLARGLRDGDVDQRLLVWPNGQQNVAGPPQIDPGQ